jgi:hypothetical protein
MPVVFVSQEPSGFADLSDARRFGRLEYLLPAGKAMLSPAPMVNKLKQDLREFSDDDYVLAMGAPSAIAAVTYVAAKNNGGRIKLLMWDKVSKSYITVQLEM